MTDDDMFEAVKQELSDMGISDSEFENEEDVDNCSHYYQDEVGGVENQESSITFTDVSLLPAPTETEALFTHNVSECLDNEEEVESDEYLKFEQHLALELRELECSQKEEEERRGMECQVVREKWQHVQKEKEERRRLSERILNDKLRSMEEAEKLYLKDVEMKEKQVKGKLQQELLQQQEQIRKLQRQVEEERKTFEEAQEQESRREEMLHCGAATTIQAAVRGLLVHRWSRMELCHRREERREEQLRRMRGLEERHKTERDEEMRRKEIEQKRERRAECEKAKEEECSCLAREQALREAEERRKEEERKMREERTRVEVEGEKQREEEKRKKSKEKEEKKKSQKEEKKKREEEEKKKREEEERNKRQDEDEKKKKEEEQKKKERQVEEKKKRQEEEKKKREEEDKMERQEEEKRKKREVEEMKQSKEEEKKKKEEEEKDKKREEEAKKQRQEEEKKKKRKEKELIDQFTQAAHSPTLFLHFSATNLPGIKAGGGNIEQNGQNKADVGQTSDGKTVDGRHPTGSTSTAATQPMCLQQCTEQKRLSWMRDCIPWSKLALLNRRKRSVSVRGRRRPKRASDADSLPPLCPDSLLQSGGWRSLQEVTTVTLEDLPGCSLSTLAQCGQLQSLIVRRCGLKALDGLSHCPKLYYIDVQENDISFVDCENLANLRVLRLGHNQLTSIHGLGGALNLDILELSYNSIRRIAGLEAVKRLQRLLVDHNHLISTKGLKDVYTLLHLDCSHNHLTGVEGLENCALLNTLDLSANNLAKPPTLNNHVLLRELCLDDNSISSLQGLADCWLPLIQVLSLAQNSVTQLPPMSDFISLVNLNLRHNCLSDLRNVCDSLEGCPFLREIHLIGNPLLKESGWRSTLQRALPFLKTIDAQVANPVPLPPAVHDGMLLSGSFLAFCQAQLQQTCALQQQHSTELRVAPSALEGPKILCRHCKEALQLAEEQRYAHEYGDSAVSEKHEDTVHTAADLTHDWDDSDAERLGECPEIASLRSSESHKIVPLRLTGDDGRGWSFQENLTLEQLPDESKSVTKMALTLSSTNANSSSSQENPTPSHLEKAPLTLCQKQELQNTAAAVIQQHWRGYRQQCRGICSPPTAESEGGRSAKGSRVTSGPSYTERRILGQHFAATVIQAHWRGYILRKRLASALASGAALHPDVEEEEEDCFEEVDLDEFVFDESTLEEDWTWLLSDSPPRTSLISDQLLYLKHPGVFPEPSVYTLPPPVSLKPKQAWVTGEQLEDTRQRVSLESTNSFRSKSPASTSVLSSLSERSEKILENWGFTDSHTALLMLKRAQKMKSRKLQQKKLDPSVRLALFSNCTTPPHHLEAYKRPVPDRREYLKVSWRRSLEAEVVVLEAVGEAEPGLQPAGRAEQMQLRQDRMYQQLSTQAAFSDRHPACDRFLPKMDPDILNGGRVQLVDSHSNLGWWTHHTEYQLCRYLEPGQYLRCVLRAHPNPPLPERPPPLFSSLCGAAAETASLPLYTWNASFPVEEVPAPQRAASAPAKKERISFRDNPVQMSGGWGGGKKRDNVSK
ncbi:leucine-rich repeat and IQ domain-containing protein 1 [Lampris incognitus]|uniref:leucine-rich repeat and IQ domain-containing protein 1 n=1 Tax=Lampris incognitus TaxID=2546036 RepID=UPI0024B5A574|nr:leucine-rich repeat and IQ domain-containing protein 1 [Lampris incognitus]